MNKKKCTRKKTKKLVKQIQAPKSQKRILSRTEIKEQRQAIQDFEMAKNPEIGNYLLKYSIKDNGLGRFGKRQAKYRYGTYGLSSMEYDSWSRANI